MKFSARLVTLAEVFFIGAITYFVYTLWRGGKVMSNLEKEMPPVMQLHTSMEECKDTFCLHLLSRVERMQYDECYNRSVSAKSSNKFGPIREGTCHFQDGIARFSVGLGSFQGSGNTWLRGLLEKVTGICTGNSELAYQLLSILHHHHIDGEIWWPGITWSGQNKVPCYGSLRSVPSLSSCLVHLYCE